MTSRYCEGVEQIVKIAMLTGCKNFVGNKEVCIQCVC